MNNQEFSEAPYYDGYKEIRNQLRKYNPLGLIGECLHYLHAPFEKPVNYLERQPWCVLLLIKWILLDDHFNDRHRPIPTAQQMRNLLQQVADLASKVRMPSEHDRIALFLRAMVFQQLLYQRRASVTLTSRQMIYFSGLDEQHYIPRKFRELTGLCLDRFLQLAMVIHTAFVGDGEVRHRIGKAWFSTLEHTGNPDDIELFLGALSDSLPGIRDTLLKRDAKTFAAGRKPRSAYEYAEQTPLIQTPLLPSAQGDYIVIDPCLLENCLGNYVYRTLRNDNVHDFMDQFGPIFEDYVRRAVTYTGLPYRSEAELKVLLGSKKKVSLVDFVITDEDANVFVDAKAAEMNYWGTVTHDALELAKLLDTSLLKAVKQANSVLASLAQIGSDDPVFTPKTRNYLIAVTFDRMNIGNGRALEDCVGKAAIDGIFAEQAYGITIPLENVYFLTIEEFEQLVAQVKIGNIGFVEALERAKASDAVATSRAFMFEQHLANWGMADAVPDYLRVTTIDALETITVGLKE